MIVEARSAGARKPNASALVGMVAAASERTAVSTTAILPNFSIMTHPSVYSAVDPHVCSLRTYASNKAQAGISNQLSRYISRHGESDDHRVTPSTSAWAIAVTALN
jgi:hypothetical protein